jgi:DNA adenine methylase
MGTAFVSPLRYPGGKGAIAPFLSQLITAQTERPTVYVEPFAGGAGAAVRLLVDEYVEHIVLNDLDRGVAAFWRSVFEDSEALASKVETCKVSVAAWRRHRNTYDRGEGTDLDLGFATFFLNRTNRSGILNARPIGGLQQTGRWKIDARFNRSELASRIRRLGRYRNRVTIRNEDGLGVISEFVRERAAFLYIDPPYLDKGDDLYLDTLSWDDHVALARRLGKAKRSKWMVSYDHDVRVPSTLYPDNRCVGFNIAHTAADQHVGEEYAVFSPALEVESLSLLRPLPT